MDDNVDEDDNEDHDEDGDKDYDKDNLEDIYKDDDKNDDTALCHSWQAAALQTDSSVACSRPQDRQAEVMMWQAGSDVAQQSASGVAGWQ